MCQRKDAQELEWKAYGWQQVYMGINQTLHRRYIEQCLGLAKKNASLAVSQSLAFTIRHPLYGHCSTRDEAAGVQSRIVSPLYWC